MTLLRRHISVLLMMAVFSLMLHVGAYHAPEIHDDHAHEHPEKSSHPDSETCIAGLAHAQLGIAQHAPVVTWIQVAIISAETDSRGYTRSLTDISGRAPPAGILLA